jgi:hypothetical protein
MSGGVFFCYRREEFGFAARAIHDRVVRRLERENVFLDVDNIDLGVDWFEVLSDRVGACDALVGGQSHGSPQYDRGGIIAAARGSPRRRRPWRIALSFPRKRESRSLDARFRGHYR